MIRNKTKNGMDWDTLKDNTTRKEWNNDAF